MAMEFSRAYTLGLIFIFLVGLIWAGASVLMQHIYQDMEFRSPFFLTYLTNSLLVMYLPLWQLWLLCGSMAKKSNKTSVSSTSTINTVDDEDTLNSLHDGKLYSDTISDGSYIQIPTYANTSVPAEPKAEPYTHLDVIQVAMVIAPLYVLSNGLYNYSLFMTSVSSSTIISNLSGTFTFAFSYYLGLEGFTYGKIFGILACFMGAVCVGLNDSEKHDSGADAGQTGAQTVMGDSVALFGAVFYGLYTTTLKYKIPDDDGISMQLLLGYVGLINVIFLAPVLVCVFTLGIEQFSHLTFTVVGFMCISGFFNNVISDYLWARSVVLTSSTVATVGLSITIPLAMISDFLVHAQAPTGLSASGAVLVIVGFCLVNISKELEAELFMSVCSALGLRGAYERVAKEVMLSTPIKRRTSELDEDDVYL